jgi:hypothetical protein
MGRRPERLQYCFFAIGPCASFSIIGSAENYTGNHRPIRLFRDARYGQATNFGKFPTGMT